MGFIKLSFIGLLLLFLFSCSNPREKPQMIYWGDAFPENIPMVFSPGLVSTRTGKETSAMFSPDGKQFFYTETNVFNKVTIFEMNLDGQVWSSPKKFQFADQGDNWALFPAPNDEHLIFSSNRHPSIGKWFPNLWITHRGNNGFWQQPEIVKMPILYDESIWNPSLSANHKLFFGSLLSQYPNYGNSDIYWSNYLADSIVIHNAGPSINTSFDESHPFIAPDESYIIFSSDRPEGIGRNDLYVSFLIDANWSEPVNLGPNINTPENEYAATVTPDYQFIFFERPVGSQTDIFWVSGDIIKQLRSNI